MPGIVRNPKDIAKMKGGHSRIGSYIRNNIVGRWNSDSFYRGDFAQNRPGLIGALHDLVSSVDPRTKEGALGLASMFVPGKMPKEIGPLYHGTPVSYKNFNYHKTSPEGLFGRGMYLTDNPSVAESYATQIDRVQYPKQNPRTVHFFKSGKEAKQFVNQKPTHRVSANLDPMDMGSYQYQSRIHEDPYASHMPNPHIVHEYQRPLPNFGPNVGIYSLHPGKLLKMEEDLDPGLLNSALMYLRDRHWGIHNAKGGFLKNDAFFRSLLGDKAQYILHGGPYSDKGPPRTNADLWNRLSNEIGYKVDPHNLLRKMGYDALHYEGGKRIGGYGEHNAYVAINPKAVRPYYQTPKSVTPKLPRQPYIGSKEFQDFMKAVRAYKAIKK